MYNEGSDIYDLKTIYPKFLWRKKEFEYYVDRFRVLKIEKSFKRAFEAFYFLELLLYKQNSSNKYLTYFTSIGLFENYVTIKNMRYKFILDDRVGYFSLPLPNFSTLQNLIKLPSHESSFKV